MNSIDVGNNKSEKSFDVSIILNLHNEARYFRRTMRSLIEAVEYAKGFDISFELVVVIDNGDEATIKIAEGYCYDAFDAVKILKVNNGSLGLSRNDGILASSGEYITTADGDDLISFDFLHKMYLVALSSAKSVVIPEFINAFGCKNYIWQFFGQNNISLASLFNNHPFLSRIMARRDVFSGISYEDNSRGSGVFYEDWHFSCEAIAAGWSFVTAKGAILFYRQRHDSLMRSHESAQVRIIAKSRYFIPDVFYKLTWAEFNESTLVQTSTPIESAIDFVNIDGVSDLVYAANNIDPAISLGVLRYGTSSSNLTQPDASARVYFEVCASLVGEEFTDVLLVPFMAKGGAEKYILSIIEAIQELQPDARLLVIGGQQFDRHEWIEKLPQGSQFLDLWGFGIPGMSMDIACMVALRLIQHVPGVRRVHMKNCEFVDTFLRRFGRFINDVDSTYYYFCDPQVSVCGNSFVNGQSFDLVAEAGMYLTRVISDHSRNLQQLDELVGAELLPPCEVVYNVCDAAANGLPPQRAQRFKLFWASRLDEQKRPFLVLMISRILHERGLNVKIDAYGGSTYGVVEADSFDGGVNLAYRGNYDGFNTLPISEYDAFLYTAAFDGLPNVVLEAMGAGLPVIAPDVGGIREVVMGTTGYLVQDHPDEAAVANNFADAIAALYSEWSIAKEKGELARSLIKERHSKSAFLGRVSEVFLLPNNL